MHSDRDLARVALSLVEGTVRGDRAADDLLAEAFTSPTEAARAHAYLSGFVIEALATARGEEASDTCAYVRRLLA